MSELHLRSGQACSVLIGITQFILPHTRFIPERAEQRLEHHNYRNLRQQSHTVLLVATHVTELDRMEA